MPHFVITVCEQEGPSAGDAQDGKTSALLRTIICTAIWSTISFMRDYLTIPCYLRGTQRFTAQRLSSTPEEQDLCADVGSTAGTGGRGAARVLKTTEYTKYSHIASHGPCSAACRQLSNFTGRFSAALKSLTLPVLGGMAVDGSQCFVHHICKWAPSQLAASTEGDARLKPLASNISECPAHICLAWLPAACCTKHAEKKQSFMGQRRSNRTAKKTDRESRRGLLKTHMINKGNKKRRQT